MLRYIIGISVITCGLLIMRRIMAGKISRRLQYALWLLVPLYMIIAPFFSIEITVPAKEIIVNEQVEVTTLPTGNSDLEPVPLDVSDESNNVTNIEKPVVTRTINWPATLRNIAGLVSLIIIGGVAVYNLGFVIYCRRKRTFVEVDPISNLKVYKLNHSSSPFLMGREIYISDSLSSHEMARYAICHEYCHFRHGDPLWTTVRFLVLALNWYNPLVWYAFMVVEQDCELACDEEVLVFVGEDKNIEYGKVLLTLLADKSLGKRDFYLTTAMNGRSKKFMKDRITNIKVTHKQSLAPVAVTLIAAVLMAGCSLVEFNEETTALDAPSSAESEVDAITSETSEVTDDSMPETSTTNVAYEGTDGMITSMEIPPLGELEDGYYTVTMTPINVTTDDGQDTATFMPWVQYAVTQEYIDNLQEWDIIDLSECDGEFSDLDQVVTELRHNEDEPFRQLGTDYTGEMLVANSSYGLYFFKVADSDIWHLMSFNRSPIHASTSWMRLPLSDDLVIYDGASMLFFGNQNGEMTPEEITAYREFTDTTYSEGSLESIRDFFAFNGDEVGFFGYDYTVIRVVDNEITEVYFWYKA